MENSYKYSLIGLELKYYFFMNQRFLAHFRYNKTKMNRDIPLNYITKVKVQNFFSVKDEIELDDFIENITSKIRMNINKISTAFDSDYDQIKNLVRELKFYEQLNLHAKQLMDELI